MGLGVRGSQAAGRVSQPVRPTDPPYGLRSLNHSPLSEGIPIECTGLERDELRLPLPPAYPRTSRLEESDLPLPFAFGTVRRDRRKYRPATFGNTRELRYSCTARYLGLREGSVGMISRGLTFIYVEYGNLERLYLELRYSLATLLHWKFHAAVDVVVYTDKPDRYRDLPIRIVDITPKIAEFSRHGLYHHRIKPCVLLEEMRSNPNFCVMTDTDTFFQDGFFEKLWSIVSAGSVAVDRFHGLNPFSKLAGFNTDLPNIGRYRYDQKTSVEYNSGLTAVDPAKHVPVIEDSIALIDAVLDQNKRQLTLEQIALSESLRVHKIHVATMYPLFRHYYRVSHKRYMQWHIRRWYEKHGAVFAPQPPTIRYTRPRVRFFRIWAKLNSMLHARDRQAQAEMKWR
ncbi:hypothetical protein H8A95_20080 [Bradyrhizobium sp. Pear76]|uniref:hypothetical protein n=1 Tax=Bradyrhizobium oropedii TaxID=1571201 RepID=UPI001E451DC6|nr:hypothetical protein [Bradyrhizobium oropedii]MCC8964552.1 hypothetical protein [Bradyrhizobium oropedii]